MDKNDGMEIVYVDPNKITLADKFIDGYINYRHFQGAPDEKKGKAVVAFDNYEMQRLEDDIQKRGLHDPIILVEKDSKLDTILRLYSHASSNFARSDSSLSMWWSTL